MTTTDTTADVPQFSTTRISNAPRELVWRAWNVETGVRLSTGGEHLIGESRG